MKHFVLLAALMFTAAASAANPTDFSIDSPIDDSRFTLSEHRGKVVVLHFLLKTECPYCLKHTHDFAKVAKDNPGIVHVFVKPDRADEIKAWSRKISREGVMDLQVIYRDPDAKLAQDFDVPDGYRFHGESVHFPALIALDGSGKEMFRYVGKSNTDRMLPAQFAIKLKSIQDAHVR